MLTLYHLSTLIIAVVHQLKQDSPRFRRMKEIPGQDRSLAHVTPTGITNIDPEKHSVITNTCKGMNLQDPMFAHKDDQVTWYMKITWVLADILYVFALVVTIVYFTALYPLVGETNFIDINVHGINSVFVLLDAFLVARPVRLLHIVYPLIYGAIYVLFSTVYWSTNKEVNVLYPGVLDWNHPTQTAIVISGLCFIALPLLHMLHFGIYRLRLFMFRKMYEVDFEEL